MPTFLQIILLAIIQGTAELLPVSSSAHVIVAKKLMGLDPTTPAMVFLLVMLHTGTMFAVITYFWSQWKALVTGEGIGGSAEEARAARFAFARSLIIATALTGIVGLGLKFVIEHLMGPNAAGEKAEIEDLFGNLRMIAVALFAAGVLIVISGRYAKKSLSNRLTNKQAAAIGIIQGLCLPFRGFSRSGATISIGMLTGLSKVTAESFSFALAVILTPPVIVRQFYRLLRERSKAEVPMDLITMVTPGLIGMLASFLAGYVALHLLSKVLEAGRWSFFGYYCFAASGLVFYLGHIGY